MLWKKIIAWVPCQICFWLGHFWSKPLEWDWVQTEEESKWIEFWVGFWYVPYNRLMYCSLVLSDWADLGMWQKCKPGEPDDPCEADEDT